MQSTQTKLVQASRGLLMMSESDYPFEYFSIPQEVLNEDVIKRLSGKPDSSIEIINVDYLFRNMMKVYPGSSDKEEEVAERFRNLLDILKTELNALKVYRIGLVDVDVYIAGISKQGIIEGLTTRLIET